MFAIVTTVIGFFVTYGSKITLVSSVFKSVTGGKSILIVALIAFLVGAGGSWYVTNKFAKAKEVKILTDALERQREAINRVIKQNDELNAINDEILTEVDDNSSRIDIASDAFQIEVAKYVQSNKGNMCNLSVGAVGLLNNLIDGKPANLSRLSEAAGNNVEKRKTSSKINQLEATRHHGLCIAKYNQLMIKHNALIDWINKSATVTNDK